MGNRYRTWRLIIPVIAFLAFTVPEIPSPGAETVCEPTKPDMLGPFYKPNAPERSSVGRGYVLSGTVKSSRDCYPIRRARIEFWLAGPDGQYDDDHRATVVTDGSGKYRFESNFPQPYYGRPPHIHLRVSAEGYWTLVTQHYPAKGLTGGTFDLVVTPEETPPRR